MLIQSEVAERLVDMVGPRISKLYVNTSGGPALILLLQIPESNNTAGIILTKFNDIIGGDSLIMQGI